MAIIYVTHTRYGAQAIRYLQGKGHNGNARRNELVTGINCSSDIDEAKTGFYAVWKHNHTRRDNKVEMYRYTQAFATYELDPNNPDDVNKCHDMGIALANKIMDQTNHLCLVATQKDGEGGNLHNHIFICDQALDTGKCLRAKQTRVYDLQHMNDEVLHSFGMEQPDTIQKDAKDIRAGVKHTMAEIKMAAKGEYVWKNDLRNRIDKVQQYAGDWNEYINELGNQGVTVKAFKKSAYNSDGTIDISKHLKRVSYSFVDAEGQQRRARDTSLGTDYGFDNTQAWLANNRQQEVINNAETETINNEFEQLAETASIDNQFTELADASARDINSDEQQSRQDTGYSRQSNGNNRRRRTRRRHQEQDGPDF